MMVVAAVVVLVVLVVVDRSDDVFPHRNPAKHPQTPPQNARALQLSPIGRTRCALFYRE